MNRPRLFLSAVSEELRTVRQAVAVTVRTLGFDPVSQDDFPTGYGELRQWLRKQIDTSEGLIQLVGHGYGAEPPEADPDYGRVSYTQFEFLYARRQNKKTWIIVAGDGCHRDQPCDQLDLPRDAVHPDPAGYQIERRKLQQDYIARLTRENHLRHTAGNTTELHNIVLRLRDELGELRQRTEGRLRCLTAAILAILLSLVVLGGGGWWAYKNLSTSVQQAALVVPTSSDTVDAAVKAVKEALEDKYRAEFKQYERQVASSQAQVEYYQEQNRELTNAAVNAVIALGQQRSQPKAPPGIEDALAQLQQGHTAAAETIFETVLAREAAVGQAANQQAAEAARHLGALAFLHDTDKALAAYSRAVELDPDNAEGWNQLGRLLHRIGQPDEAIDAFKHMLTLVTKSGDQHLLAMAYSNLGNVYRFQGDLVQATVMHREALKLDEALGRKEGIANTYGNLGNVYRVRGDLAQAEVMHREALKLNEELGHKKGMANAYTNLGLVYSDRGDLVQAEAMYRKALPLYQQIGAAPYIKKYADYWIRCL